MGTSMMMASRFRLGRQLSSNSPERYIQRAVTSESLVTSLMEQFDHFQTAFVLGEFLPSVFALETLSSSQRTSLAQLPYLDVIPDRAIGRHR